MRGANSVGPRLFSPILLLTLSALALSRSVAGDEPGGPSGPSLAIVGGTVYPVSAPPIADGVVIVENGRVARVGPRQETPIPEGMRVIPAAGQSVIPGLVDLSSGYLSERGPSRPTASLGVTDALETSHPLVALLRREGITTVGVSPSTSTAVGGLGSAIKLVRSTPDALTPLTLRFDAYLHLKLGLASVSLGAPRSSTVERLDQYYQVRGLFVAARDYKKKWDTYWEAVANYNKAVQKWKEARKKAAEQKEKKPPAPAPARKPAPTPVKKPETPPSPREFPAKGGSAAAEEEKKEGEKGKEENPAQKKPAAPQPKPEPKAPTPPRRPPVDRDKEVLLRALSGKLPVLITAHRRDDIEHALRLKEEFGLDLIVAGAVEGHLRADRLKRAGVPVAVGPILLSKWGVELLHHREQNAANLAAAGVPVAIAGVGVEGLASRHLRLQASVAVRGGLPRDRALRAITLEPATRLGVAGRVGSLEVGKDADLVILDGDPLDATSRIRRVLINGSSVHPREGEF